MPSMKKPPMYRTVKERDQQYIVNIAELSDRKVEVYKPGGTGELIPLIELDVPAELTRSSAEPIELRRYVLKNIRATENYLKAAKIRTEFEESKHVRILADDRTVQDKLLPMLDVEDKRKNPESAGGKKKTASSKKTEKSGAGRTSWAEDAKRR